MDNEKANEKAKEYLRKKYSNYIKKIQNIIDNLDDEVKHRCFYLSILASSMEMDTVVMGRCIDLMHGITHDNVDSDDNDND
jgi:hypothetical protein